MNTQTKTAIKFNLESIALSHVWTDFTLSRQAMQCTPSTMQWYSFTAGAFVRWLAEQGVNSPDEITAAHVRQYLVNLQGKSSNTIHGNARAIRTFLKFLFAEGHIIQAVKFDMPRLETKRMLALTAEQVQIVLKACGTRDRAMLAFMVDTGLRRAEVCALNWQDVDFNTGLVRVVRGKGGKFRSVVAGAKVRRLLLAWKRIAKNTDPAAPLFSTSQGARLQGNAIRQLCRRLADKTGIAITPHSLRRTSATLGLKSGEDLETLRRRLGHSSLEMTSRYLTLLDEDMIQSSKQHSPIDRLGQ